MEEILFDTGLQKEVEKIVWMEKLTSEEMFLRSGEEEAALRPVLFEIDLLIQKGEIWGISGPSLFEIRLLLEITANIRPYRSGKCVLVEQGMMRRKRKILPHVFYIGSPGMIYKNMNVLEYLMFATAKRMKDTVARQEWIFEYLIASGLKNISLTPAATLTKEQKAVVVLLAGALSDSQLIVFNFPEYRFDETLTGAIAQIAGLIKKSGKNLLLGTQAGDLIEAACTHIAFLKEGRVRFSGGVKEFCEEYDKVLLTVWDENIALLADRLQAVLPQYRFEIREDSLIVSRGFAKGDVKLVLEKIVEGGFTPRRIIVNPKRVQNACEGILEKL